ncbi:hypothetical protein ACOMHN_008404 [Nucella lapillus]
MEVILSQRGGQKLCLDGYMYVRKLQKRDWIRWQCVIQRSAHCKGAVTTDLNVAEVRSRMEHSHEPDRVAVGGQKLRGRMKATARATRSKPGQILAQGLQDASEETRDGLDSWSLSNVTFGVKDGLCSQRNPRCSLGLYSRMNGGPLVARMLCCFYSMTVDQILPTE